MKKHLFILIVSILVSCSSSKKITEKATSKKQDPTLVELILTEKPENFIWKKGDFLDLRARITNKSKVPITILSPKSSYQTNKDYFSVNFIGNFEGMVCEFEVTEDNIKRKSREFLTILPNESKDVYISGRSYFIKYCNKESSNTEEIQLNLRYNFYETKHNYDSQSYFIAKNYKTKLNEKDEQEIQSKIQYLKNSSRMKRLSDEKQKEQLLRVEQSLRKKMINSTPEEQKLIIENYNSLFQKKLESNIITIKVEK